MTASDTEISKRKNETIKADHPDAQAVGALLAANGLKNIKVEDVSVVEGTVFADTMMPGGGFSW